MVFDDTLHDDELASLDAVSAHERFFALLDAWEVRFVANAAEACDRSGTRRVAQTATLLGNGWLYPILSALVVAAGIDRPLRFMMSALLSFGLAFAVYPLLKSFLARTRPCDYDPSLIRGVPPLDTHSCPSGHAMTASAYSVPLVWALPETFILAFVIVVIVSWSRVALGHHYVSDVIVGAALGLVVAVPITSMMY
ncbi:MAG: phosphatase PAP2 family protein [Thermoanaerobaculia bacterium]